MKVCVITDNDFIFNAFQEIIAERKLTKIFDFYFSSSNEGFVKKYLDRTDFRPIMLKQENDDFFSQYDLYLSLHCKQMFSDRLVENYRCINVHPGFNPYNRGWFPQVFSIINKLPIGVTIHEMDSKLDHGPIIFQEQIDILEHDTSLDVYNKIQKLEIDMLKRYLPCLLKADYSTTVPQYEGNVNYKADFDRLCMLDLNKQGTFGEFLGILRATTFDKCDNAYFYGSDGNKVYVSINLKKTLNKRLFMTSSKHTY